MRQNQQSQRRELCPHLAAAALWMSKGSRTPPSSKRMGYSRAFGAAADDLAAL